MCRIVAPFGIIFETDLGVLHVSGCVGENGNGEKDEVASFKILRYYEFSLENVGREKIIA